MYFSICILQFYIVWNVHQNPYGCRLTHGRMTLTVNYCQGSKGSEGFGSRGNFIRSSNPQREHRELSDHCWKSWRFRKPLYLWSATYPWTHSLTSPNLTSSSKYSATLCCDPSPSPPLSIRHRHLTASSQRDLLLLEAELREWGAMKRTWDHLRFGEISTSMSHCLNLSDSRVNLNQGRLERVSSD